MPGGDGTGPFGGHGRRVGYCAGYDLPGYMNDAAGTAGRGRNRGGHGGGRGRGGGARRRMRGAWRTRGWIDPPATRDEATIDADEAQLLQRIDGLQRTLARLTERVDQMAVSERATAIPPSTDREE